MLNKWKDLNHLQLGKYAEYLAKMKFTKSGFDVYSAEVDDKGIDFIVRRPPRSELTPKVFFEIQVKSVRDGNYTFISKDKMDINDPLFLVCFLQFVDFEEPKVHLIPATAWQEPNEVLKTKDYDGLKSKPEWGIVSSKKHMSLLDKYKFDKGIRYLHDYNPTQT